jgi:hypothetical protein
LNCRQVAASLETVDRPLLVNAVEKVGS